MVAREVVDGGAYGLELVYKVIRDLLLGWGLCLGLVGGGGEVVKGKDIGGHHG